MEQYEFEGTTYNVAPNRLEEFKSQFPNAIKLEKTNGSQIEDATASQVDTASKLEDTSSESKETKLWGGIVPFQVDKKEDVKKEDDDTSSIGAMASSLGLGFVEFAKNVSSLTEQIELGVTELLTPGEMTEEERQVEMLKIKAKRKAGLGTIPSADAFNPIIDKLEENLPEYETGSITEDLFVKGNYAQGAERAVNAALRSAPSLVAATLGPGGLIALASSSAGGKFEEEFKADPSQTSGKLLLNAGITGATEALFERVTGGIIKQAGLLKQAGNAEGAKEVLKNGAGSIAKRFGIALTKEGASEMATELAIALEDKLTLGKEINSRDLMYRLGDAGIVGSLVGGSISSVGEIAKTSKAAKERAEYVLAPQEIKNQLKDRAKQINVLAADLSDSTPEGKVEINNKIEEITNDIVIIKKRNSNMLSNIKGEDLTNYAKNIDEASKQALRVKQSTSDSEKIIATQKLEDAVAASNSIVEKSADRVIQENIDNVEKVSREAFGNEVEIKRLTSDEVAEFVKETNQDLDEETLQRLSEESAQSQGFFDVRTIDGKQNIIINTDVASSTYGVNIAGHEFLHKTLSKTLRDNPQTQIDLGSALINKMADMDLKQVTNSRFAKRLEQYASAPENVQGEEILNILSDSLVNGDLNFNESIFTRIGDVIRQFLQDIGFKTVKFNNGQDVFNFIKDYNKSIGKGRLGKAITKVAKEGVTGKLVSPALTQEVTEDVSKFSRDTEASDKVQEIYNESGEAGMFDIFEQFKPITTRIARRFREVPGYDEQLVIDEIETGERGMIDLIRSYKPESGVPLAAYINKFLPARSIEAGNRILKTEFESDVTEAKAVTATETAEDTIEPTKAPARKTKLKVLADELNVSSKVSSAIVEQLPTLDLEKLDFKKLKNLVPNVTGNLFGIAPKKLISLANITKSELADAQRFISKNADLLIQSLPEGYTTEGKATGVPKSMLEAFYNKRSVRAKTKAGLQVQVKKPSIKKSDFLAVFGIIDGKPNRDDRNTSARVLALANMTGKMMTNQAVRQQLLKDESSPVHVLSILEDGKSELMFAKDTPLSKEAIQEIGRRSRAVGETLKEEQANWNKMLKVYDMEPVNMKSSEGRKAYKQWLYTELAAKLPESFFRHYGTFAGTTKSIKDADGNTIGRDYAGNYAFLSNPEVSNAIDNAKTDGVIFADEDADVANAVKKVSYTNLTKKFNSKDFQKAQESKRRGFKKIWQTLESMIQDDPALNGPMVAAMLSSTSAYQGHFMRTASPIAFFNRLNDTHVEEHTAPASDLAKFLFNRSVQGNINQYFDGAVEGYFQGLLPKQYDNKLKGENKAGEKYNYTANAPLEYIYDILMGSKSVWIRYFNPNVNSNDGGIDPNQLVLSNGKTIAEEHNVNVDNSDLSPSIISKQQDLLFSIFNGDITEVEARKSINKYTNNFDIVKDKSSTRDNNMTLSNSISNSRTVNEPKGITVLDFDDTLATTTSNVLYTAPDGTKGKMNAEEFALRGAELEAEGYVYDFSEFSKVIGGKTAPLFQKALKLQSKFGSDNMFVLTARPANAASAIHTFIKANGLDIPLKNITGLANGAPEAKALWVANKVSEGYNDFYFADDALKNVQAVQNMLEQFDVKSKVQQAKLKFSKDLNSEFNKMLERTKGIGAEKVYSRVAAEKRGKNIGRFEFFVPPSAEDFTGLLRYFVSEGKQGNADLEFFNKALIKPFARADREMTMMRQSLLEDYKGITKKFPSIKKKLGKLIDGEGFTFDNAVRVYLWGEAGFEIPGLSKRDAKNLSDIVKSDEDLQAFADMLGLISKQEEGYSKPGEHWSTETIEFDLQNIVSKISRKQFLGEWKENKDIIFSTENLNKIEAFYGSNFRSAMEDILTRMETGVNRTFGSNKIVNSWLNWVNGSVGAIMFFNSRSAVLQTLSTVNFINFEDNNIFAAGKAFANQKQYWSDFSTLFNSDFLKSRRAGLATNVNEAELASAVAGATNKSKAALAYLLKIGFTPTQIADSFAISAGGSTYYRNRLNKYIQEGIDKTEAEKKAFLDFQEVAEETQQSARPDRISQQQASPLGRLILAFGNTPMQYNRLIKKAAGDLINKRGDWRSNASRIVYYGAIQNIIFSALQQAIFALAFDDEDNEKQLETKSMRTLNSMVDTLLRGSGLTGAVVATAKNAILKFMEEEKKGFRADYDNVAIEAINVSPPIGSKVRKVIKAGDTYKFNKDVMGEMDTLDLDNPMWEAIGNVVSAVTNLPIDRAFRKIDNIKEALNSNNQTWQRIFVGLGWDQWGLGIDSRKDVKEVKEKIKEKKKEEKKKKQQRCSQIKSDGSRCKNMVDKPKTLCYAHD